MKIFQSATFALLNQGFLLKSLNILVQASKAILAVS